MNDTIISSKSNEKIKNIKKLQQKKYRKQFKKFTIENWATISDAYDSGVLFDAIYVTQEFEQVNRKRLKEMLKATTPEKITVISSPVNAFLSHLDTPSGVCAVYDITKGSLDNDTSVVYLNRIGDPGNLGTILRTCVAFDIKTVVLDEECVDIYNPKVLQAAKDSIFKVNIVFDNKLQELKQIKKNMKVIGSVVNGGTKFNQYKFPKQVCIVLGSESHGIDDDVAKLIDDSVSINISKKMESLNVACAASIILYKYYLDINHKLSC